MRTLEGGVRWLMLLVACFLLVACASTSSDPPGLRSVRQQTWWLFEKDGPNPWFNRISTHASKEECFAEAAKASARSPELPHQCIRFRFMLTSPLGPPQELPDRVTVPIGGGAGVRSERDPRAPMSLPPSTIQTSSQIGPLMDTAEECARRRRSDIQECHTVSGEIIEIPATGGR